MRFKGSCAIHFCCPSSSISVRRLGDGPSNWCVATPSPSFIACRRTSPFCMRRCGSARFHDVRVRVPSGCAAYRCNRAIATICVSTCNTPHLMDDRLYSCRFSVLSQMIEFRFVVPLLRDHLDLENGWTVSAPITLTVAMVHVDEDISAQWKGSFNTL